MNRYSWISARRCLLSHDYHRQGGENRRNPLLVWDNTIIIIDRSLFFENPYYDTVTEPKAGDGGVLFVQRRPPPGTGRALLFLVILFF